MLCYRQQFELHDLYICLTCIFLGNWAFDIDVQMRNGGIRKSDTMGPDYGTKRSHRDAYEYI